MLSMLLIEKRSESLWWRKPKMSYKQKYDNNNSVQRNEHKKFPSNLWNVSKLLSYAEVIFIE